jgi:hypothetical protein
MSLLTIEEFKTWYNESTDSRSELASLDKKMLDRIEFIYETICKSNKTKLDCFYHQDAPEGEVGPIREAVQVFRTVEDGWFGECMVVSAKNSAITILMDDELTRIGGSEGFPLKWIWSDDWISQLGDLKKQAKIRQEEEQVAKDAKKIAMKDTRKTLIESIKSKLTKEELKCIKFK